MTKSGEVARAELRDQGVAGVELQVFRGAVDALKDQCPGFTTMALDEILRRSS
jgi:hypothetical protein